MDALSLLPAAVAAGSVLVAWVTVTILDWFAQRKEGQDV